MYQTDSNILIVEDDAAMRVYVRAVLLKSGCKPGRILEASNGREGMAVLERKDVHLILTDINMPQMNGIEFMERLRNHPIHRNIPVVAITTESGTNLLNMLEFWGHGYVQKPFKPGVLHEQISKFYGKNNEHYYLHG